MFESIEETNISRAKPFADGHEYSSLDLQYEICSKYIKRTSQQLYQQELELMH